MNTARLLPLCLLALAGCSTEYTETISSRSGQCAALVGDAGTVHFEADPGCSGCLAATPEAAVDGDPASHALLTLPLAAESGARLRAQAPAGVVYPGGVTAAVRARIEISGSVALRSELLVRTYLGDQVQDETTYDIANGLLAINGVSSYGDVDGSLVPVPAQAPFDAVEMELRGSFNGYSAKVFEFCSDSLQ